MGKPRDLAVTKLFALSETSLTAHSALLPPHFRIASPSDACKALQKPMISLHTFYETRQGLANAVEHHY